MNCTKNMLRVGAGIGAGLLVAYLVFPELRAALVALAPIAVVLVCPLSILLMMKMMSSSTPDQKRKLAPIPLDREPVEQDRITS
jgi:ribosomal protein RSM22 (predicted rRNA methylase)